MTLATAALIAGAALTTACEGPMGPPGHDGRLYKTVVDNIEILPGDWRGYTVDNLFDHYFVDIEMPELTREVFYDGFYYTYWKYMDGQVLVQEGEGVSMYLERELPNGEWVAYTETISCSYEVGSMRISISRSDFWDGRPGRLVFRFVAFW